MSFLSRKEAAMNKDCSKVSIERGSDGRFTVLLTGSKDDTPMLAEARLHQKIGDDAKRWRFEPRQLPGKYATFSPVL